jgi:two-component system, response regulator PdtaR
VHLCQSTMPWPAPVEYKLLPRNLLVFFSAPADVPGSGKRPAEPVRLLVVEDDFLVATEIETALVEAGFDVAGTAVSAEEAIALAVSEHPTLVVMDVRLAGKRDGIDAAIELFRDHGIRCIFATAHCDQESQRRASSAVPLGWLQKPYTMESLVELIQKSVG